MCKTEKKKTLVICFCDEIKEQKISVNRLKFTHGTLFSSLAFCTGAIDGVEMDFCNGMRQMVGAKFRLALSFSKSR